MDFHICNTYYICYMCGTPYIYIHTHTSTSTFACTYTCTSTHTYTYMYIYIYIYIYIDLYICACIPVLTFVHARIGRRYNLAVHGHVALLRNPHAFKDGRPYACYRDPKATLWEVRSLHVLLYDIVKPIPAKTPGLFLLPYATFLWA